jgi:phosphocarrier protein HPr
MKECEVVIKHELGLHARPAALFVQTANKYKDTQIEIVKDGKSGNAKSILNVLALGVGKGAKITIKAEGPEEDKALEDLVGLIESNFGDA